MTIKERPLIKAVERLGPLPGFLFSSMIFAGIVSMFGCALFGGFFVLFQVMGRGTVNALVVFEYVRGGAVAGVLVGAAVHMMIAVVALAKGEETGLRLRFVLGGVMGAAMLAAADILTRDQLRPWLATVGDLQ